MPKTFLLHTSHIFPPPHWSLLDLRLQKLEEGKGKESIGFHGSLPCISFRSPLYGSSIGEQQVADLRHWKTSPPPSFLARTCREKREWLRHFPICTHNMQCQHFTPEYKNSIWFWMKWSLTSLFFSNTHTQSPLYPNTHTHTLFYTHTQTHRHTHTHTHTHKITFFHTLLMLLCHSL